MDQYFLKTIITESWKELITNEGFEFNSNKSNKYQYWIENEKCALIIKIERYIDRFDIRLLNPKNKRPFSISIFSLIETLKGVNSILFPYLLNTSSKLNEGKYFYQRYFLNQKNLLNQNFENQLSLFQDIIRIELDEVLKGNFDSFELYKERFLSYHKNEFQTQNEKIELEKDSHKFYIETFKFPEKKIIDEVKAQLKKDGISKSTKYKVSESEKKWLNSIDITKEKFRKTLSVEYISYFEMIHEISLPRDYKLFLNYIGNGFYRFRSLEHSISNSEDIFYFQHFEFIELTRPFILQKQTQNHSSSGYLRIYDYGCGIVYYLIIKGDRYGEIWYQNPEFGEMVELNKDYDTWIPNFRSFLKTVVCI